jgi:hypothetical protein
MSVCESSKRLSLSRAPSVKNHSPCRPAAAISAMRVSKSPMVSDASTRAPSSSGAERVTILTTPASALGPYPTEAAP